MDFLKTDGIVLKEIPAGDADKILFILSSKAGKIKVYARGARRPRNRFSLSSQFLCYAEYVLTYGKEMYTLSSAEVKESFYETRTDLELLTYSAHMSDILQDVVMENQPAGKTLQLFLNSIFMMSKKQKNKALITKIFELRLLKILGYASCMRDCSVCHTMRQEHFFSFSNCGIMCSECKNRDPHATKISEGTLQAIGHITCSPLEKLFGFDVSATVLQELEYVVSRFLQDRLERKYTKLNFLDKI